MNNSFKISSLFAMVRTNTAWAREIVTAHNLLPERAAFIAAILAGIRPNLPIPSVSPATKRFPERRANALAAKIGDE